MQCHKTQTFKFKAIDIMIGLNNHQFLNNYSDSLALDWIFWPCREFLTPLGLLGCAGTSCSFLCWHCYKWSSLLLHCLDLVWLLGKWCNTLKVPLLYGLIRDDIWILKYEICNLKFATWNLQLEKWNVKFEMLVT